MAAFYRRDARPGRRLRPLVLRARSRRRPLLRRRSRRRRSSFVAVARTVLAARAPDARRAPASITKLMTVMVALEHTRLDDVVTVTPEAARVGESSIALRVGEHLPVRDLAIAALVPSANDAATALAVHVGHGSVPRFVALMNAKARALGLRSTHFENPHGLDQRGPRIERARHDDDARCGLAQPVHPDVVDEADGHDRRRPRAHLDRRAARARFRSSAPRPVTRTPPGGPRSRPRSVAECGSPPPCSGRRARRSGTPTWARSSSGDSSSSSRSR